MPDYTELVTQLRSFAESDGDERCGACKYEEDYPPCVSCINRMASDAADAIQSLSNMPDTWLRFPCAKKPYADSTLRNMTKAELIQIIRDYEHNYAALYEANERGIAYAEQKFRLLNATKLLKRLTVRDIEGNAHLRDSNDVGWVDPVSRLALLEDIIEEARR